MFVFVPRLTLYVMLFLYLRPPFSFHLNSSSPPFLNKILDVSFDTLETIYVAWRSRHREDRFILFGQPNHQCFEKTKNPSMFFFSILNMCTNVPFKLVVNQHPEGDPAGDHWEISPTPGVDSPGVKSDNPRGGILEKFGVQVWLITSMRK